MSTSGSEGAWQALGGLREEIDLIDRAIVELYRIQSLR